MTNQEIRRKSPSKELLIDVKYACTRSGATVRLRKLFQECCIHLVITEGTRDQVNEAMVRLGALSSTEIPFTSPDIQSCWQGNEITFFVPSTKGANQ